MALSSSLSLTLTSKQEATCPIVIGRGRPGTHSLHHEPLRDSRVWPGIAESLQERIAPAATVAAVVQRQHVLLLRLLLSLKLKRVIRSCGGEHKPGGADAAVVVVLLLLRQLLLLSPADAEIEGERAGVRPGGEGPAGAARELLNHGAEVVGVGVEKCRRGPTGCPRPPPYRLGDPALGGVQVTRTTTAASSSSTADTAGDSAQTYSLVGGGGGGGGGGGWGGDVGCDRGGVGDSVSEHGRGRGLARQHLVAVELEPISGGGHGFEIGRAHV